MKLLLIIGGRSTENEISRMSALNIRKNIPDNYIVNTIGISKEGIWYNLTNDNYTSDNWLDNAEEIDNIIKYIKEFDVVFPVLHGKYGEDGTIQGMLEMIGIPYVGMKVLGSCVALDKVATKMLLKGFNINMVPYLYVRKKNDNKLVIIDEDMKENTNILDEVDKKLGYPVFVKAANLGSSVGCYKVENKDELMDKINLAGSFDNKILIEKAINARELECAVLGNDEVVVSTVGEVLASGEYYTYDSKYNDKNSKVKIPADISIENTKLIQDMAFKIFKILDGKGLSRCDFFLDKITGAIYFNEINTMPGFTDISMYPMLIENMGINGKNLIKKLIELALESKNK